MKNILPDSFTQFSSSSSKYVKNNNEIGETIFHISLQNIILGVGIEKQVDVLHVDPNEVSTR